jgi:hypothetical protein
MQEIVDKIDFFNSQTEIRILNIVGLPGIGKSTLAIHVGHAMIDKGVVVHYINMAENLNEPIQQLLTEKVLESSQIVTEKTGNFERLQRWARECYWYNLLILDNCDDFLNNQKEKFQETLDNIVKMSLNVKVLMTSREVIINLDYLDHYKIYELSTKAACDLLTKKIPASLNLTMEQREKIAELTGRVPLALQIISSLLALPNPPSPREVISELEKQPIKALSHDRLPASKQVNASFSLSYKYLSTELRTIGICIACFPGSFKSEAAVHSIMQGMPMGQKIMKSNIIKGLRTLVERSLIEHNMRAQRFYYHRLIREYFCGQNRSVVNHTLSGFHSFYSEQLYKFAKQFSSYDHKHSIAFLDGDKHNVQQLLDSIAQQKITRRREMFVVLISLASALDLNLLRIRFVQEELDKPLQAALIYLDHYVPPYIAKYSKTKSRSMHTCDYTEPQINVTVHRLVCTYVSFMYHVATIQENLHGIKAAVRVLVDRKSNMKSMTKFIQPYIRFYKQLATYYEIMGSKNELIECHELILKQIQEYDISFCRKSKMCRYDAVAHMYLSLNNKLDAIRFFELSLKEEPHTIIERADILYYVCTIHASLEDGKKILQCLELLLELQPELLNAPSTSILLRSETIRRIAQFCRRNNKKEEADALEQKLVDSIIDESTKPDYWSLHKVVGTVKDAFYSRNYSRTVEIGFQILPQLESSEKVDTGMITHNIMMPAKYKTLELETRVLIGRAKFLSKNRSEGLDYLQTIFESDLMKYDSDSLSLRSVICKYLIFRPRYFKTCFPFEPHLLNPLVLGKVFLYYGLWYLPNVTLITEFLSSHESHHTVYPQFRSQFTEVVSTGDRGISVFMYNTIFPWVINVNETVHRILESSKMSVLNILNIIGFIPFLLIQICCCCCRATVVIRCLKLWYSRFKVSSFIFIAMCILFLFITFYSVHLETI